MGHKNFHSMIRPSWKANYRSHGIEYKVKVFNAKVALRELSWILKKGETYGLCSIR